jgi:hypothetical protein
MKDWPSSVALLAASFAGMVLLTIGLAAVIAPDRPSGFLDGDPMSSGVAVEGTPPPVDRAPTAIGGTLVLSGDLDETLVLDREDAEIGFNFDTETGIALLEDGPYRLVGEEGRVTFAVDPLAVEQLDVAGLSFYPGPDDCQVTPGVLNAKLGIASAGIRCDEIVDIRDNGVVTIDGTIAVAGDALGMRGELPPTGGTIAVGTATIELPEARIFLDPFGFDAATGLASEPLFDDDRESGLVLAYDPETGELSLSTIVAGPDAFAEVPDGACSVERGDLGVLNPRTTVVELGIHCEALDVAELGTVAVDGTLVVDLIGVDERP